MPAPARFWLVVLRRTAAGFVARWRVQIAALLLTSIAASLVLPGPWDASRAQAAKVIAYPTRELAELRSAKTRTVRQPDGSLKTTVSQQSLHFLDPDEKWKAIDPSFKASAKQDTKWESGENRFSVELAETAKAGFLTFRTPDGSVSLSLEGGAAVDGAKGQENAVILKSALPDVDLEYVVLPDGVKESIVLRKPGAPNEYRFRLVPGAGQSWRAEEGEGGVSFFRESKSEPAFVLPPPVVGDSSDQAVPQPDPALQAPPSWAAALGKAAMKVEEQEDGSFLLTLTIDQKWLEDESRVYPIVLDPTLYVQPDTADGEYETTNPNGNPNVTSPEIRTGRNGSGGAKYASVLNFDLGTLPPGAKVLDAHLNAYLSACFPTACGTGHTGDVELRRLSSGWSASTPWASVEVDPSLKDKISFTTTPAVAWHQWGSGAFTQTVQSIVNGGTANYGFILERNAVNDTVGYKWRSSHGSDPSFAPYMDVYWVADGVQVDPAARLHSNGAELVWQHYAGGTSAYADAVFQDSPVGYWRLDEAAGDMTAWDWAGNDLTGTFQSSTGLTRAEPGPLADGDPSTKLLAGPYAQVADDPVLDVGNTFTLETWIRLNQLPSTYYTILSKGSLGGYGVRVNPSGKVELVASWVAVLATSTGTIANTNWHHLVVTKSAGTVNFYLDGAAAGTSTGAGNVSDNANPLLLGIDKNWQSQATAFPWNGWLDEVAIYPTALSSPRVSAHYSAASTPMPGFQRFEIHRSATPSFTPSSSTLVGTIADSATQTYRDTSAKAQVTFYYEVVTVTDEGSFSSNEVKTDLPASGLAQVTIQPGYISTSASGTHILEATPNTPVESGQALTVGSAGTNETRALIKFDMRSLPTGVDVTSAQLQMYALGTTPAINAHRLAAHWSEGGATWNAYDSGTEPDLWWTTSGGDFDASVSGSSAGGSNLHWDSWEIGALVEEWVAGQKAHHGVLLKYGSENGSQPTINWAADGYFRAIALRPKLVVTYQDGSTAVAPSVAVAQPAASELVKGTVTVKAGALDDGRVTQVEFFLDGSTSLGTDATAPYETSWNTTTASRGSHTMTAKATDEAGNLTTSQGVSVTVGNGASPTVSQPTASSGGGYASTVSGDSPNAWWRLGEASGTSFASEVGSFTGTWTGSPTLGAAGALAGDANTAVTLNGTSQYGSASDATGLDFTNNFSLEAWIKRTQGGVFQAIVGKPLATVTKNENYAFAFNGGNRLRFEVGNGTTSHVIISPSPGLDTNWHHAVGTWASGTVKLYIDGALVGTETASFTTAAANASALEIGRRGTTEYFGGSLDELAVYPSVLSLTQVQAHHQAGTAPTSDPTIDVSSTASDDFAVSKVEFYADGDRFATDSSSPYAATWDTLDEANVPGYDGTHSITARAYDADGNVTTSTATNVAVANTAGTKYKATISTANVPLEQSWDPGGGAQDGAPLTVSLTNTSTLNWATASTKLRYRWYSADSPPVATDSANVSIGADLGAGLQRNVSVTVDPPALPTGVYRARYKLRLDLYDTGASIYFAAKGNKPYETWVTVTREVGDELGLERYQQYDGEDLGGGFDHALNLANGNNVVQWVPFSQPGRGLNTVVSMTYNSLEHGSVSPLGNNWSLAISSLTPFGLPLDVHPNAADTAAGRTQKWVGFTDGDGSYHVFTGNSGGTYYAAPPGVHLYLKSVASGWELWKPDRTRFVFDSAGFPTSVSDATGNALTFTLATPAAGEDAYGLAKRVTTITDAGGRDFTVTYFSKAETPRPALRGKVKKLTDHVGHALEFTYYEDGNLRSIREKGGPGDDGMPTPDREVVFNYTTPDGTGPAIGTLAGRQNPDPLTVQSPKLYSAIDFRTNETSFAYSTAADAKKWRISGRTNRAGSQTTFSYDTTARTTTETMPLSRVWTYTFDSEGRVTQIDDPVNTAHTTVEWADATAPNEVANVVRKVAQPSGEFVEYAYNANGYKTDEWDELRNRQTFEYENIAVDANDASGNWEAGRSIPHLSQLSALVKPRGNATTSNPDDYRWEFAYTGTGLVDTVTDPLGNVTDNAWNANGTLASQMLPANGDGITRTTTFTAYDANGLATQVTDAAGGVTKAGHAANGNLLFVQDPNHGSYTGGTPSHYRTEHFYDAFGRLVQSAQPKSTAFAAGLLTWEGSAYDANDNVATSLAAHYGRGDGGNGAPTATVYDAMDRETLVTGPRTAAQGGPVKTQTQYDAAGRITRVTDPKGVDSGPADDYVTETAYDLLDREATVTSYAIESGATRSTNHCYDDAGDLRSVTGPKGAGSFTGCPNPAADPYVYASATHTTKFEYDDAHRQLKATDALAQVTETGYDENGEVTSETDEAGKVTQTSYDDRGLRSKLVEPFDTGRTLSTVWEYDPLGNLKRLISPRAFDAAGGGPTFTDYVESYSYDALARLVTTTLPASTGAGYSGMVVGDGPAAYWRLGEGSGTTGADASGNNLPITYVNGVTLGQQGVFGVGQDTAAGFDGTNDYATRAVVTTVTTNVTVETWAYWTGTSSAALVVYNGNSGSNGYGLYVNNGSCAAGNKITVLVGGISCAATGSSTTMPTNQWTHLAAVRSGTTWTLYVNGFASGTGTTTPNAPGGSTVLAGSGGLSFPGRIDEPAIYTRALTADEVREHYEQGAVTPQAYRHQAYDPNGNTLWTSLATTASTPGAVTQAEKTTLAYWDTGSIHSSQDPANPKVRFDWTAEGWQTSRIPEVVGGPGFLNFGQAMYWDYLADGLLRALLDQGGERALYAYDANGNRTQATEATGLVAPGQSPLTIDLFSNSLDELTKVRAPKPGAPGTYLATALSYDLHGNTIELVDNREENGAGQQTAAGRLFSYTYNAIDQATAQTDDFATSTPTTDDEQLTYSYKPTGELDTQKLQKRPSGSWVDEQSSVKTYFENGLLKTLINRTGAGDLMEQHALAYLQGSVYLNGNRVSDVFQLRGPDSNAPCYAATCTASWTYDARERVTNENPGTGSATTFTLDVQGNVTQEVIGSATTTRTYSGQQLQTEDFSSGTDRRYLYDSLGNTDCIVKLAYAGTGCPAAGSTDLLEDNIYDYKSRLGAYRYYNGSPTASKTVDYTNDPLDRPIKQVETISGATTIYDFTYVGVTNAASKEVLSGATNTTKKYAYDAFGQRATITEGPGANPNRYSYLYDPHGSVSLLINQANVVKESYGYSAYGASNAALTKTAAGFSNKTNPYRYSGKRLDSGSGTYDMGARRYSAATGRFLQYDVFYSALENLGLSSDPLTQNRYALAGGNPISFVEIDGHWAVFYDSGGTQYQTCGGFADCTDMKSPTSLRDVAGFACDLTLVCGTAKSVVEGDPLGVAVSFLPGGGIIKRGIRLGRGASRGSPWDLTPLARGRDIQGRLAGVWGRDLDSLARVNNFRGIDQFNFKTGLATSIKSIDTGAKSYRSAARLENRVFQDAKKLSAFGGAAAGRGRHHVEITPGMVKARQLVVVVPQGGVSINQASALGRAAERARKLGVTVTFVSMP